MPKVNSFYGLSLGKLYIATFFCFFALVACLFKDKEKKPRKFSVCVALGIFWMPFLYLCYSVYSFVGVSVKCPIHLLIGQGAVNASTHDQSTILQDFLPCVFLALRNHIKHSFKDVLCPYSVNFLLHNLKIQPLIIYIPLALHWIICGV